MPPYYQGTSTLPDGVVSIVSVVRDVEGNYQCSLNCMLRLK